MLQPRTVFYVAHTTRKIVFRGSQKQLSQAGETTAAILLPVKIGDFCTRVRDPPAKIISGNKKKNPALPAGDAAGASIPLWPTALHLCPAPLPEGEGSAAFAATAGWLPSQIWEGSGWCCLCRRGRRLLFRRWRLGGTKGED